MTGITRLSWFASTILLLALPATAFDASDLEGHWSGPSIYATTGTNTPAIVEFNLVVAADGGVSGTSSTYGPEAPVQVVEVIGGTLTVNAQGRVNGTLELEDDVEIQILDSQMNQGKDLISNVGSLSAPNSSFLNLVKRGSSYADADLEGAWWLYGYYENIQSDDHDPGWIWGELTINSSATTLGGELHYQYDATTYPIPAGIDVNMTSAGGISTSPDLGGDFYAWLAAGKTLMIGRAVGWEDGGENEHELFLLVKGSSGATSADLAGNWSITGFHDTQVSIDPGTTTGTLTVDETGTQVTGGVLTENDGSKQVVTGGNVSAPDSEGYFSITDLTDAGTVVSTDLWLNLSPSRDVAFGIASDTDEYSSLVVAMKLPEPGAGLLGWAALMALAGLRQRPWARR